MKGIRKTNKDLVYFLVTCHERLESMIMANDLFLRKLLNGYACRGVWVNIDLLRQLTPNVT